MVVNRVVRNNTEKDIIINELGMYISQGRSVNVAMIAREVLAEPVILKPGEAHSFTMRIGL